MSGEEAALAIVRHSWDTAYDIAGDGRGLRAVRKDRRGKPITAATADELGLAIAADYAADPVPRDLPAASR